MKFKNKDVQRVYDHALTLNPMDLHGLGTTSATFQSGYKFGLNGHIDAYTKYGKVKNTKLYAIYHAGVALAMREKRDEV
tara:strand:- start:451 stop:687 length:237 start_codon:yes stop_codon:yes gene_type:complete